jgi:hypothetical protein
MKEWKKITIMFFIGILVFLYGFAQGTQRAEWERDLYINRLYDKDRIIEMWETRATDNLKLIRNYCDEMTNYFSLVVFNLSDCNIYQTHNGDQNVMCERNKAVFAVTNKR